MSATNKESNGTSLSMSAFAPPTKKEKKITDVSRSFWEKQITYPQYGTTKQRRMHELQYIMAIIPSVDPKILLDIGCGTGSTVTLLRELTHIETYYCFDISPGMLSSIDTNELRGSRVIKSEMDLAKEGSSSTLTFPDADLTLALGVFQCFPDYVVQAVMNSVPSKHLIIRNACYTPLQGSQQVVTVSEKLKSEYACVYRTFDDYVRLAASCNWDVLDMRRAFPDAIESEFGSKQWIMHLVKHEHAIACGTEAKDDVASH